MESNNADYRFDTNTVNSRGSFREHNEQMKAFCEAHDDITVVNTPGCDIVPILRNTRRLQIHPTITDTGGSRLVDGIDDWSILVDALEVTRHKFWQN